MMTIDTSTHQFLTDKEGNKKSVLLSFAEYEHMLATIRKYEEFHEFESSMIENFKEIKAIKQGKVKPKSLLSLLDEL
jgi:hypothetical protein